MSFLFVLIVALTASSDQSPVSFRARLSTVPIDVAMQTTVAGRGSVVATLSGQTLTISGEFAELKSPATSVKLHRSPNRGIRGPGIADLAAAQATSGSITGKVELSSSQADDLKAGRLYIQLQSEKAPDGNLWGWLLPTGSRR